MTKMIIPFVDLAGQFRNLEGELTKAFLDIGRSGVYVMGEGSSLLRPKLPSIAV